MSFNKIIVILGITLLIFAGIILFQFRAKSDKNSPSKAPTGTVKINDQTFKIEVAETPKEQMSGLSGRSSLDQGQGMLFIFKDSGYHNFWMKNMKFPIDIIFIKDDLIISIEKNAKPADSKTVNPPLIKPLEPINKVLEINAGLTDKYNIKKDDSVEFDLK